MGTVHVDPPSARGLVARTRAPRGAATAALVAISALASTARADEARQRITSLGAFDVVLERATPSAETDERAAGDLLAIDARGVSVVLARDVTDAGPLGARGALFVVDRTRALVRLEVTGLDAGLRALDVRATVIVDRVLGAPAVLIDGSLVVSRLGDEPGESDLWLVPSTRGAPRILFGAPGADDRPVALDDGRLLFVSTRSTIASVWIGDVTTGEARPLTNAGLRAGRGSRAGFVPPPHGPITIERGRAVYDAGDAVWRVELTTGRSARVSRDGGR
ncbi:hypothetical protein L6R52_04210 [Myxococcota bacterium]|nr:hypothetical protein [Myxococcota bacterium]